MLLRVKFAFWKWNVYYIYIYIFFYILFNIVVEIEENIKSTADHVLRHFAKDTI